VIAEVGDGDREIDWELMERKMEEPERKQKERLIR
jgi:hypothetical protein